MNSLLRCFVSTSLLTGLLSSGWAAPDAGWLMPAEGETFQTQPDYGIPTARGVLCAVDFDKSIDQAVFYDGDNLLQGTKAWKPSLIPGKRTFYIRLGLSAPGPTTLKAVGSNAFTSVTVNGPTINLVTIAPPPIFTSRPPLSVSSSKVTLLGSVDPRGALSSGTINVQYGLTAAYGMEQVGGGISLPHASRNFEAKITIKNLQPATEYHYRQVYSIGGAKYSEDQTFTTLPNLPPVTRPDIGVLTVNGVADIYPTRNDSDEGMDGPPLLLSAAHGLHGTTQITPGAPPSIRYTPGPNFPGRDTFTYRVADQFGLESEGTVEIRDVARHWEGIAGSYQASVQRAGIPIGSFSLQVTRTGAYSGRLVIRGISHPFTGVFSRAEAGGGESSSAAKRASGPVLGPFRWAFSVGYNQDGFPEVSGGPTTGGQLTWSEIVPAVVHLPANEVVAEEGTYNLALPNPDLSTAPLLPQPRGDGFAIMRVGKKGGRMATTGRTGDGQPFSSGGRMRQDRRIFLLASSSLGRQACLSGLVGFNVAEENVAGQLYWEHQGIPYQASRSGVYSGGFYLHIQATGEKFVPPPRDTPIFSFPVGATPEVGVEVRDYDRAVVSDGTVRLVKNRLDSGAAHPNPVRIAINPRTGLFNGTLRQTGKKAIRLMGIIQPKAGLGIGVAGPTGEEGPVRLSVP